MGTCHMTCAHIAQTIQSHHVCTPSSAPLSSKITLRGLVLPVGGVRDKVLAARRGGIRRVILPARNRGDLHDLPQEAAQGLRFTFVETIGDVMFAVFPSEDDASHADPGAAAADEAEGGAERAGFHHAGHLSQQCRQQRRQERSAAGTGRGGGKDVWDGDDLVSRVLLESFL